MQKSSNRVKIFSMIAALAFFFAAIGSDAAVSDRISSPATYMPLPGLEIKQTTELSRAGWLRYAVITVDTSANDFYIGPFSATGYLDRPSAVLETLISHSLLAAVNGDFFDTGTGMPLSMVVSEGALIRSPRKDPDFSTLCMVSSFSPYIQSFSWSARLVAQDGSGLLISSYNELSVGASDAVLYNSMRADRKYPKGAKIAILSGNTVIGVFTADNSGRISEAALSLGFEFEVVGTGDKADFIKKLAIGEQIRLEFNLLPPYPMEAAFSGKPVLVKNGMKADGLSKHPEISGNTRAPRTMAGITWDGKLLLVAVEGRSSDSTGVTLEEAALLMLRLGCREALNLDGGGSTQAAATDGILPRLLIAPSSGERKVSYSIGVLSRQGLSPIIAPRLIAAPLSGPSFDVPSLGLAAKPGGAYSGLVEELPVVTPGTTLTLSPEAGAPPELAIISGKEYLDQRGHCVTVTAPGYILLEAVSGGIVYRYAILATGRPQEARFTSTIAAEDGISFGISAFDNAGRRIPLPASGLDLAVIFDGRRMELPAPFIPMSILAEALGFVAIDLMFQGKVLDSCSLSLSPGRPVEQHSLGFDEAGGWSAYGAPNSALVGFMLEEGPEGSIAAISYDFSGTGVRAAYIKADKMIPIPGGASYLSIMAETSLSGGHWLRANIRDASNNRLFLDFGRLAGSGWAEYRAELPEGGPFYLEQVYVVEFKDELSSAGKVLLSRIAAEYDGKNGTVISFEGLSGSVRPFVYMPTVSGQLSMAAGIIASFGTASVPGGVKIMKMDFTGGIAFINGIGQWQRLYEACTIPGKSGTLVIEVLGNRNPIAEASEPLTWTKDINERLLLRSLAERAAFMGYSEVIVLERGSSKVLLTKLGGAFFLSIPSQVE